MKGKLKLVDFPGLSRFRSMFLLLVIFFAMVVAQTVTGKETDENEKNLSVASVILKKAAAGYTIDASGQCLIAVASNPILSFSSIGFRHLEYL